MVHYYRVNFDSPYFFPFLSYDIIIVLPPHPHQRIIIHKEHCWTTTWVAVGDTICVRPQQTEKGEEGDKQRVGFGLCSIDTLSELVTWEMGKITQGKQHESRRRTRNFCIYFPPA